MRYILDVSDDRDSPTEFHIQMKVPVLTAVPLLLASILGAASQGPLELSLVDEYRNTRVFDLSNDGRRILNYERDRSRITVFDLGDRRAVAGWKIGYWPVFAQFLAEGNSVFYEEFLGRPRIASVGDTGATPDCSSRGPFKPVDNRFAIGYRKDPEAKRFLFVRVSLQDCSIAGEVDPQVDASGRISVEGDYAVSRSADRFAYLAQVIVQDYTRVTKAWVRDASNLELVSFLDHQEGWWFEEATFTPDGSQVVIRAQEFGLSEDEEASRFFFFAASSGALVRTFDSANATSGLAVSPDSRLLATASRETEQRKGKRYIRIRVKVYDFYSGQELASGDFPWRKEPPPRERISWGGNRVQFLKFSPDGKKLYASSEDTRVWDIPGNLIQLTASQATPANPSPPPSTAGTPASQQPAAPVAEEEEIPEGDQCYVYAIDAERARKWYEELDLAKFEALPLEEQKALASQAEKHFELFSPEIAEEALTTKHYQLPFGEGKITASVFYTDESTAVKVGDRSAVLETMFLCVVLGDEEYPNACDAEGAAVAETAAGYAPKNRVMSRSELDGRKYIVGMVCERPSAIESMMNEAQGAP